MFRKKHSDINIKLPFRPYSPLHSKKHSPSPFDQSNRNLSPMKNHNRTPTARQGRPQFLPNTAPKSPRNIENTFEAQLSSLAHQVRPQYAESRPPNQPKFGYRADTTTEGTSFCNLSAFSKDVPMKESKRLFTKCISEMHSAKRKQEAEGSSFVCMADTSRRAGAEGYGSSRKEGTATSFKALKIQMIESVLPDDKYTPEKKLQGVDMDRFNSATNNVQEQPCPATKELEVRDFQIEDQEKKEKVIEFINHSFSDNQISKLTERAKIIESVHQSEHSDYTEFDLLLRKVSLHASGSGKKEEEEQSVRASLESIDSEFNFDLRP